MKTLQEQYNLIKEGKGHKGVFLTEAKKQFPDMLTNPMGFEETAKILKTRGVISENYVDLKPINTIEATPKTIWETKFAQFLAEEAKAVEKKTTKEVEKTQANNFNYKDKTNLDNQIGQEVLNGIYFEAKENPDKSLDEIRKIVAKKLAEDGQYYMKNAAFGVKGLGYKEAEMQEVSGKYKSSGYSDKLKKMVKESLVKEEEDLNEESFEDKMARLRAFKDQQKMGTAPSVKVANKKQTLQQKLNMLKRAYMDLISDMEKESDLEFAASGDWYQEQLDDMENAISDLENKIKSINENMEVVGMEEAEAEPKPEKKKVKKESLDADLAEIDTQAGIVAMEAKLDKISEMISAKMERLGMIEEDTNLAELVDKGKMKAMQKEIKILEKRKAKMEKVYEKMTGKAYTKEMVDESSLDNE